MKKHFVVLLLILAASFVALPASTVLAAPPENSTAGGRIFGTLWYDGITKYAPGDPEYLGGHWAVYFVTWNVTPYLIESYDELMTAWGASDISIVRMPSADVLCPVMP